MTKQTSNSESAEVSVADRRSASRSASLKKRHARERRFQWYGRISVAFGIACVVFLFTDIISNGIGAFKQTYMNLEVEFDADSLGLTPNSSREEILDASFGSFFKKRVRAEFPDVTNRRDKRKLYALFTSDMPLILRDMVLANPAIIGTTQTVSMIADDDVDVYFKHAYGQESNDISRLSEQQQKKTTKGTLFSPLPPQIQDHVSHPFQIPQDQVRRSCPSRPKRRRSCRVERSKERKQGKSNPGAQKEVGYPHRQSDQK